MTDILTSEQRRLNMSRIRNVDTKPELLLRRGLHMRGFRFLLYRKDLPGRPDLTLPKYRSVILVHGCFWHGHCCPMFQLPKTRQEFWINKIQKNRERDAEVYKALAASEWRTFVLWECSTRGPARLPVDSILDEVIQWLNGTSAFGTLQGHWTDSSTFSEL